MELQEIKERYADLLAAESTVEAYLLDGALYYRYEWLNEVEMMPEIVYYRLVGDEDGGVFCQHLDRHAGEGVGFMHHHRDPHFGRFAQDRPADIAAGADGDIRPEIPEDFRGGGAGGDRVDGGGQVAPYVLH